MSAIPGGPLSDEERERLHRAFAEQSARPSYILQLPQETKARRDGPSGAEALLGLLLYAPMAAAAAWVIQRLWLWHLADWLPIDVPSIPQVWVLGMVVSVLRGPRDIEEIDVLDILTKHLLLFGLVLLVGSVLPQ